MTNIWPRLASNHFDLILKVASNHKTVKLRGLRFANFVKSHYKAESAVTWRPGRFLCRVFVEFWSNIVQLIWKKETNMMDHRFANFSRAGNPNDMKVKNVFKKSSYLVLVICFYQPFWYENDDLDYQPLWPYLWWPLNDPLNLCSCV